jgi:hypothetical protein
MNTRVRSVMQLTFLLFLSGPAQSEWLPAFADTSYPRVLLKNNNITSVRNNLLNAPNNTLYIQVYASGSSAFYIPNISDDDRRARAIKAKNAAFIYLMNVKISGKNLVSLTQQERDTTLSHCLRYLNNINTAIDSITISNYNAYDSWQWRSKELIDYLIAYDFLKGAGVNNLLIANAKKRLQLFAGNLYKESNRFVVIGNFWSLVSNNFTLIVTGALGTASVVLNDAQSADSNYLPEKWIQAAMIKTDDALFTNAKRETERNIMAGFAEGPHYLLYALAHYTPFYIALKNFIPDGTTSYTFASVTKKIRHPYYDKAYDLLFEWLYKIRMPDGRVPAIEDSFIDEFISALSLTGKEKYNILPTFNNLEPQQTKNFVSSLNSADDVLANYLCMNYKSFNTNFNNDSLFSVMPVAGDVLFRSSWDSNAVYMHVTSKYGTARTGAGGHNHSDELSYLIYAYGQLLALDAGYIQYNSRTLVCNSNNHNMILVNGNGTPCGSIFSAGGADAFIDSHYSFPEFDLVQTHTQYQNATIERDILFMDKKYFVTADFIQSGVPNNYTYQLHGWGQENGNDSTGEFHETATGRVIYKKNDVSLLAEIKSMPNASYTKTLSPHELTYNTFQNHTAYNATSSNVNAGHFLALLFPYRQSEPNATVINRTSHLLMKYKNENIITKNDTSLISIPLKGDTIQTDGNLTYASDSSGYTTVFAKNVSSLYKKTLVSLNEISIDFNWRSTIYLKQINDTIFDFYCDSGMMIQWNNHHKLKNASSNVKNIFIGNISYYEFTFLKTGWHRIIFEKQIATALNAIVHDFKVIVYPNPAAEELCVTTPSTNWNKSRLVAGIGVNAPKYIIDDLTGRALLSGDLEDDRTMINISGLATGIYYLRIGNSVIRFVKK